MGGSAEVEQTTTAPHDIVKYLNELYAYAITLGMSYNDYWIDEPDLINCYIEAEKIRERKKNQELWLQGAYIYQAIGCLYPLFNPFSKEHKAREYLKQPFPLTEEERQEQFERRLERYLNSLVGLKPKE